MNVVIASPAPRSSTLGNQITAERWAGFLRQLGHRVTIVPSSAAGEAGDAELLIALHAKKSAGLVDDFHRRRPGRPLIVGLTGTDLYGDLPAGDGAALRSLELAWRLVGLHPKVPDDVPAHFRSKVRVIVQSAPAPAERPEPRDDCFEVCVSGHLRAVKDPFRTAEAVRSLPAASRVRVTHLGAALDAEMAARARAEMAANERYAWLGAVPHAEALRLQARARVLALTSHMEGGANVVCEALAASVPVISSRIDGSIGLLGEDYPGFFPVGDTAALTRLLLAAETDADFYGELSERVRSRRDLVDPARERAAWADLIAEPR